MSFQDKCPIWGTPAIFEASNGDTTKINSLRAGGLYSITGSARQILASYVDQFPSPIKAKITTWLVDERRHGVREPLITEITLETLRVAKPLSVTARRDRLLQYVISRSPLLGDTIRLSGDAVEINLSKTDAELQAWTESVSGSEAYELARYAREGNLLERNDHYLRLSIEGHQHLESLQRQAPSYKQAFVAMWFGEEMRGAYELGIRPAIIDCGYEPMRIDGKEHANKIDDEIIAEIRRSKFLVADFTAGTVGGTNREQVVIPRGGVYYEAGFALGIGIPVIWLCREDQIGSVHFDTRQFNHIAWKDSSDLKERLKNRIGAVLGPGN